MTVRVNSWYGKGMSTRTRTVAERIGDWKQAYDAVSAELNPLDLKGLVARLGVTLPEAQVPTTPEEAEAYAKQIVAATGTIQASMNLARIIAENQRTAATVAEGLVRLGLDREKERDV